MMKKPIELILRFILDAHFFIIRMFFRLIANSQFIAINKQNVSLPLICYFQFPITSATFNSEAREQEIVIFHAASTDGLCKRYISLYRASLQSVCLCVLYTSKYNR